MHSPHIPIAAVRLTSHFSGPDGSRFCAMTSPAIMREKEVAILVGRGRAARRAS